MSSVSIFASPEQFRQAFENVLTKNVQGPSTPGQTIKENQTRWYGSLGVRFAKSAKVKENLEFYAGDLDQSCAVYSQLEVIRKVVLQVIPKESRKVTIPYYDDYTYTCFEETPEDIKGFYKWRKEASSCSEENCTSSYHSVHASLHSLIVKPALDELLTSLGCSISKGPAIVQMVEFESYDSDTHFSTMQLTLSEEAFGYFPEHEKVEVKKPLGVMQGVVKAYENGKFTDFEIRAKDGSLKAHKLILCSAVPFFEGLNNLGGQEAKENCLVLEKFSASTVKAALDFIYKGTNPFENAKHDVNAEEVLVLAEQWELALLKDFAAIEIGKHADSAQFKEINELAEKYNQPYLKKMARYLERKAAEGNNGSGSGSGSSSSSSKPQPSPKQEALPLDAEQ